MDLQKQIEKEKKEKQQQAEDGNPTVTTGNGKFLVLEEGEDQCRAESVPGQQSHSAFYVGFDPAQAASRQGMLTQMPVGA